MYAPLLVNFIALAWWSHPASAQHKDSPTVYNASISNTVPINFSLFRRQNDEPRTCSAEKECEDKSCCADTGFCGLSEEHCSEDVCISNCDAKAECGAWAEDPGTECPLNVCCNKWGYCGMTEDFCNDECQSNCEQPPSTGLNRGDVLNLVIGYYEAWAPTREGQCPKRNPQWIPTDSISHLNVAFAYMEPDTYNIVMMDGISEEVFRQVTALKQTAPGLKIWMSLGGWTYSDNGTSTQSVWGDIASTAAKRGKFILNLVNAMTHFGFDGVDLDWEYPGAPDRGGKDRDIENFVLLVSELRQFFDAQRNGWGISFTAPTSYWYMRWFNMGELAKYVDWINLMSYDLHGSWDSPESYIGSYVYAHTNLSEISDALDLLWRNDVPANKVNLGLGFYGRSYTLEDASCTMPGCPFVSGGEAGMCTGESGILSYAEISAVYETYNIDPVLDEEAGVRYFAWGDDQWVSYDDAGTIKQKVDYANENGLLGIFIWALDLDTEEHGLLDAALSSKGGLGAFREQNGVGPGDMIDWTPANGECYLSACQSSPACSRTYRHVGHDLRCGPNKSPTRLLCCSRDNAPDANTCSWRSQVIDNLGVTFCRNSQCERDEVKVVESEWYWDEDESKHKRCLLGRASYCCKASVSAKSKCGMLRDTCIDVEDGRPVGEDPCGVIGREFVTYSQDRCPLDKWAPWCCETDYDSDDCHWTEKEAGSTCEDAKSCPANEINMGVSHRGEGKDCEVSWGEGYAPGYYSSARAWCCPAGGQSQFDQKSPVPLEWLFVDEVTESEKVDIEMSIQAEADENHDPNENGFGWVIMAGPEKDLTSVDKRDGSHWELFDCPDRDSVTEDDRITVRAVCANDSLESNCAKLFNGGVERTVVEMPSDCGIGRYAMAVNMVKSQNQTLPPTLVKRLAKRSDVSLKRGVLPRVYDFTFDYDFSVLHGRADSDVQVRIDYSDSPSYWEAIVDNQPGVDPASTLERRDSPRRREMREDVERNHGGSWKRYAEHTFRKHRRETPQEEMHDLHRRWFPTDEDEIQAWMSAMQAINEHEFKQDIELASHHVQDTFSFWLFNENLDCTIGGIPYSAFFAAWADLHIDIKTSAMLTLIGRLNDLDSFKQSSVLFRNTGNIQTGIHMETQATVRFSTGQLELFGMENFGVAFNAPGIVTIGPNLRILGELTGTFTAHAQAHYNLEVTSWDYTQRYPNPDNDVLSGLGPDSKIDQPPGAEQDPDMDSPFSADVTVHGDITARVVPIVEFGIRWNPKFKVSNTAISLRCDTHATLYGRAGVGTDIDPEVCYGAVAGAELFAQIEAPTILGYNPNRRYSFYKLDVDIIEEKCYPLEAFSPSKECEGC